MKPEPVKWAWWDDRGQTPPGSAGVEVNGVKYTFGKFSEADVQRFMEARAEIEEVFNILLKARRAFESGQARSYENAVDRLTALLREYRQTELRLANVIMGFSVFFEPAGMMDKFLGNSADMAKFLEEAQVKVMFEAREK